MQILKCFLVVCAAAYPMAVLPLHAADADTDAKLREALEKKLNELQTQPATAAPQLTTPMPKTSAAPAPAMVVPSAAELEVIAKERAALRQKMSELQGQPGPAATSVPAIAQPAPKPAPPAQPPPVVARPAPAPAVQPAQPPAIAAPAPVSEESIAKAREALRQKMNELESQPPAPVIAPAPAPAPVAAAPAPAAKPAAAAPQVAATAPTAAPPPPQRPPKKYSKGPLAFPPIQGPAPAISASKEARLAELLRKYKADEITPEEYHQQRAKILGEP